MEKDQITYVQGMKKNQVVGIYWEKCKHAWKILVTGTPVRGSKIPKQICGGYFKAAANTQAARAEALDKAKQALAKLMEKHQITYVQGMKKKSSRSHHY